MSNHLLPEPPAHARLRPDTPTFRPVTGKAADVITAVLGKGELRGLGDEGRHFLFRGREGEEYFLRLVDDVSLERQLQADRVAVFLSGHGVNCPCLHPEPPVRLPEGRWLLKAAFIPHRFALVAEEDLYALGRQAGLMHRVLRDYPGEPECRDRTMERLAMLRRRAGLILEAGAVPGTRCERLRRLVESGQRRLWEVLEGGDPQCTHGDLHYTNVIFPLRGGVPLLLDFEDSTMSWFDPVLDLAQLLERFVLTSGQPRQRQRQLAGALLEGYAQGGGPAVFGPDRPLRDCLHALSLRSLLTLAEVEAAGRAVAEEEWEKFFTLHEAAGNAPDLPGIPA